MLSIFTFFHVFLNIIANESKPNQMNFAGADKFDELLLGHTHCYVGNGKNSLGITAAFYMTLAMINHASKLTWPNKITVNIGLGLLFFNM